MVSHDAPTPLEIDRPRLNACLRAALWCQVACISCAEKCLQQGTPDALGIVQSCLRCLEACVGLLRAAEEPANGVIVRVALESCLRACAVLEREILSDLPAFERHAGIIAKFAERCHEVLDLRLPASPTEPPGSLRV